MTTHNCPIPGCGAKIAATKLLCARHWSRVPRELQTRVYSAYRQRRADDDASIKEHRAAARAAIQAAREVMK